MKSEGQHVPAMHQNQSDYFRGFATKTANVVGSKWAFASAVLIILVWGVTGPYFKYSDSWQLVINTGTTIVTFLMVFLIQSTQNRDAKALHLKMDELIRSVETARNTLVDLESMTDEELSSLEKEFKQLREKSVSLEKEVKAQSGRQDNAKV